MVQRIWNSPILATRLKARIKASESACGTAANLKAAKHRFESYATPLGRLFLHLEEFLDEVQETCEDRHDKIEGRDCWNWLEGLDMEKLYQLAMVADCCDEILVATRGMDAENIDTSTMHTTAVELLDRLDALFNRKQCLEIPGYTKHALDILMRPRIIYGPDGAITSIGGRVDQAALCNCFRRMTAYTALVADVVKTEFPDYELFCAFNIFNLTDNSKAGNGNDIALRRLAQAFDVNHAALKDQYHRLRSVALQKKRDGVVGNKDAWKEAVQSCRRAIAHNVGWNMDALLPVLWRFVGWTAATSGVEQNFSKALRSIGHQRGSLTSEHEETAVRFAVYKPNATEQEDLIRRARIIWDKHYGCTRQAQTQRCDKGMHRGQACAGNTEKFWLEQRRAAAQEVGEKMGHASALTIESAKDGPGWTVGHDDEHEFQSKKRAKKKLEAFEDGLLLEHEVHEGMQNELDALKLRQKTADKAIKHKLAKRRERQTTGMPLKIKPGTVTCLKASTNIDELSKSLRLHLALLEGEPSVNTQLLVVDNPVELAKLHKWTAALNGMMVASAQSVLALHRGQHVGAFIKYRMAVAHNTCVLYITPQFQHKHGQITELLRQACQLNGSRWRISNAKLSKCKVLGGEQGGISAKQFLKSITCIIRSESRAR